MATLPYMPLFVADYLGATSHLTHLENSVYLTLLMASWQRGSGLPANAERLARIARVDDATWESIAPTIAAFFVERDGMWINERLETVMTKAVEKSTKARASALSKPKRPQSDRKANAERTLNGRRADAEQLNVKEKGEREGKDESETGVTDSLNQESNSPTPGVDRIGIRSLADQFDEFWSRYPNKVGKAAALAKFRSIAKAKLVTFTDLMAGLERYAGKQDDRPWCNPATWLNQHRWADEPPTPTALGASHARPSARVQNARNAFGRVIQRALDDERADAGRPAGDNGRHALAPPVDDERSA